MNTIYYVMKLDNILKVFLNKDKANKMLKKLRDENDNDYATYYIIENKSYMSNELLNNGYNKIHTITLNGTPLYSIINNEFTAIKLLNKLKKSNSTDEWVRVYSIRTDIIECKGMI